MYISICNRKSICRSFFIEPFYSQKKVSLMRSHYQHNFKLRPNTSFLIRRLTTQNNINNIKGDNHIFHFITNKYKMPIIAGLSVLIGSLFFYKKQSEKSKEKEIISLEQVISKPLIDHLPESIEYLLIGGGTTSLAAAKSIRANDPKSKVLIISQEDNYPYMRPPLSKELLYTDVETANKLSFTQWNGKERSIFYEHEEFYAPLEKLNSLEYGGISVVKGFEVTNLDLNKDERIATLDNGQSIKFNKCLLATGGEPKTLDILEKNDKEIKDRVFLFRNINDFKKLNEISRSCKSITIIGGGLLGSELACALGHRSSLSKGLFTVNQIFSEPGNLDKILPKYLSEWTTKLVKKEGVNVIPNVTINSVSKEGNEIVLKLNNGNTVKTDYLIVAIGLEPNVKLAKSGNLELDDEKGGYRVNSELQARSNVWVAGDACCFYDPKLGRRRVEHHDHAIVSGRLAGENMTGAGKIYKHQSMFWSDLGPDIGFEAIGLVDSTLPTVSVFAKEVEKEKKDVEKVLEGEKKGSEDDQKEVKSLSTSNYEINEPKYEKGIVFYLKEDIIVGIILWNVFNRMSIARRIINEAKSYDDLTEVAKLFQIK